MNWTPLSQANLQPGRKYMIAPAMNINVVNKKKNILALRRGAIIEGPHIFLRIEEPYSEKQFDASRSTKLETIPELNARVAIFEATNGTQETIPLNAFSYIRNFGKLRHRGGTRKTPSRRKRSMTKKN
jgi:hypothetical protein